MKKKEKKQMLSAKQERQLEIETITNELEMLNKYIWEEVNHFQELEKANGSEEQLTAISGLIEAMLEQRAKLHERLDSLTAKDNSALCMRIRVVGTAIVTVISIVLSAFIEDVLGRLIRKQRPTEKI